MSTRCQVQIIGIDINPDKFTLYHHCDGYPTNMLPLLASAEGDTWQHGRAGKATAFIIATDPGGYEPEQGHELHGDIEYYYQVTVGKGDWTVEAFAVDGWGEDHKLRSIAGPMSLQEAAKQAESIEAA